MAAVGRAFCSAWLALLLATGAAGSSHGCEYDFEILKVGSRLNLKGDLNGHQLHMKHHGERPTPSGILALTLSKCPHGGSEMVTLQHFSYTFHSKGTLSVHPLSNVEVKAGPVTVHVSGLQIGLNGTQVVQVDGSYFNTVLKMETRSGIASALGHSYDLTGCMASVPMKGYFAYDGLSGDIVFHVYDFNAPFVISLPEVSGEFTVFGSLTALHLGSGMLQAAPPALLGLGSGRGVRFSSLLESGALGAIALVVVGLVAAVALAVLAVRRSGLARNTPGLAAVPGARPPGATGTLLPSAVPRSDGACITGVEACGAKEAMRAQ